MKINEYELNEKLHDIVINPYITEEDLAIKCELINKYNIKNITTKLNFTSELRKNLKRNKVKINSLVSFPFADIPNCLLKEVIGFAENEGSDGIEYMPNFFKFLKNDTNSFASDIETVIGAGIPTRIIISKNKLTKNSFVKVIKVCMEMGIKNFQFGDGFGSPLNPNEIKEIKEIFKDKIDIKVIGGISDIYQVKDFLDSGAECIGSSRIFEIFKYLNSNDN